MNLKLLILLFASNVLMGQTTFNHQYDLNYPFKVFTSILPTDSCFYVTGILTDTTNNTFKIGNIFLKLDLAGEIEFERTLLSEGTWYETWRGDLINDGSGNLLDVGYKTDTTRSAILIRYNAIGDTIETKSYLNPYFPDDTFIVTAALKRNENGNLLLLCGIDNNPIAANPDIYLIELDHDGTLLNSYTYGNPTITEIPYSMVIDSDGGIIIGSNSTNDGFVSNNFYSRSLVFKVSNSGDLVWEYKSPPGQLFDIARDMVKSPDGGLIIASGKGIEHVINSESSQLRWNAYIFKLNTNQQFEWGTELRGVRHSASTGLEKIVATVDGSGYVATGRLIEDKSIGEPAFGSWIVKVSPDGDSLWARYYSFFDNLKCQPRPYDLKNTPDGGYVIVGETKPQLPATTLLRAWIMKLDEHGCLIPGCEAGDTVSTSTALPVEKTPVHLAIYPNPTTDYLNFQLRTARHVKAVSFRILDAQGRVLREFESSHPGDTFIVPVSGWAAGVYFLEASEGGAVLGVERFVVME